MLLIGSTILAETASAGVGISAKVGTTGYGGDLTVGLLPQLNVRAGFNTFSYGMTESDTDEEGGGSTDISADLKLQTIPILLDWHPWAGRFRLSAGMVVNNNELSLYAVPGDTVDINDVEYVVQHVDGKASFNQIAPYIGIGTGNAADTSSHLHFAFDLGVMFQGEPKIEIQATASDSRLQSRLNADVAEEQRKLEDDASVFNMYPVLTIGLSYTF